MKNTLKTLLTITLMTCLNSVAQEQSSNTSTDTKTTHNYQTEAAECIAFYKYGETATKHDISFHDMTNRFKSLKAYLIKQLTLDVGEENIDKLRRTGRKNVKKFLEANDHKYFLKEGGNEYSTELLDVFKQYNPQCESVISYYQNLSQTNEANK